MRLAAGLRPDPLGELERSPRPPSRNEGCLLLREGGGKGKGGRGREGREGKGSHTLFDTFRRLCDDVE